MRRPVRTIGGARTGEPSRRPPDRRRHCGNLGPQSQLPLRDLMQADRHHSSTSASCWRCSPSRRHPVHCQCCQDFLLTFQGRQLSARWRMRQVRRWSLPSLFLGSAERMPLARPRRKDTDREAAATKLRHRPAKRSLRYNPGDDFLTHRL